jgi:hypothetical protein
VSSQEEAVEHRGFPLRSEGIEVVFMMEVPHRAPLKKSSIIRTAIGGKRKRILLRRARLIDVLELIAKETVKSIGRGCCYESFTRQFGSISIRLYRLNT